MKSGGKPSKELIMVKKPFCYQRRVSKKCVEDTVFSLYYNDDTQGNMQS